jgi:uncharacterized protein (TIGR03437 family)
MASPVRLLRTPICCSVNIQVEMPMISARLLYAALLAAPLALAQDFGDCPMPEKQVKLTIQNQPSTALPGQSVKYSVFATPVIGNFNPSGTISITDVTLLDSPVDLTSAKLDQGQTTLAATFYTAGTRRLGFVYSGDATYCSVSVIFGQIVDRITPGISLTSSSLAVAAGNPVAITAQIGASVAKGVPAPVGPVQFLESGTVIGTADLVDGKATFSTAKLSAGQHQITATLIGDPNYYSVRSSPLTVTVSPATTFTLLSATATATDVTFKITVNSNGGAPQTGSVQLMDTTTNTTLATVALPGSSLTLPLAKVTAGHPIAAVYSEGTTYSTSTSATVTLAAFLNAAGAPSPNIAPDEIVSLFGGGFASSTLTPTSGQQPTTLGGVSVTIADRTGASRLAPLYLVSPTQINLIVPAAVVNGAATLTVTGSTANIIPIQLNIAAVAPGLFNPGPQILHISADGTRTVETVTGPITLDPAPGGTYLILYATGLRHNSDQGNFGISAVTATVGNLTLPVNYAGPQSQFAGLDQVQILLPDSLKGAGKVNLILTVDAQITNAISLQFQ